MARARIEAPVRSPVMPLALAGGGALLLGLAFLSWHALEQGLIAAGGRLALGTAAAIGMMLGAWPLARRGHAAVAGAVGGAGLGAWFSAWIVARHVHDLVSAPLTFGALAIAAAAGLAIADRLRLRLMAALACVGACATPALTGADRLGELMAYQLVVLGLLVVLDARRRWPELPTIGLLGTWALAIFWAAQHLDATTAHAFIACCGVLLVVTVASCWRSFVSASEIVAEHGHLAVRLTLTGVMTSAAVGWTFHAQPIALASVTAVLAAWHAALAFVLHHRGAVQVARVATWLAWIQAAAVPVPVLDGVDLSVWWAAMAIGAAVATWMGSQRVGPRLVVLPTLCAVGWAIDHSGTSWAFAAGLFAAAIPLAVGVWPGRVHEPRVGLVALGSVSWIAIAIATGPASLDLRLLWGIVPTIVVAARSLVRAPSTSWLVVVHLMGSLFAATIVAADARALEGGAFPTALLAVLVVLAVLGAIVLVRARPSTSGDVHIGGLVVAALGGLALALVVPQLGSVVDWPLSLAAGRTAALAIPGLVLVIAGLRFHDDVWRQAGLVVIVAGAAKVVLFDTAGAPLIARALSFIGIGVILILGALAYSNAQRRAVTSDPRR